MWQHARIQWTAYKIQCMAYKSQCMACSLDRLSPKSHPLSRRDHVPSQKAPCPSIPALGSTGCRQWVSAATAEQLLQLHIPLPPRCRQRVMVPASDTSVNIQGHWAPLVLASLEPFSLHP